MYVMAYLSIAVSRIDFLIATFINIQDIDKELPKENIDITKPIDIDDAEESARIAAISHRDHVVRASGVVEIVRRLLAHVANSKIHFRSIVS